MYSRTSCAMKRMKLTACCGSPVYRLRSSGSWVAMPTGQVLRWQTRIITQPSDDERRGGEAELLRAQQRPDDHVAAGLELAVHLHRDARAEVVEQQHLVGLGEAQLPRHARVLDGGERRGAGAAVMAADEDHVRVRLGDARGDRAHAHLGHQLHAHACVLVGVLEVVDELREVLDGVDVVVRRRADEAHAGGASGGPWRSRGRPWSRAAGRPRRAWRPGPS